MNLHTIVGPSIGAVNPIVNVELQVAAGFTTTTSGKQEPTYAAGVTVQAQVQPLQYRDMLQLDGINLQGRAKAMYLSGNVQGIVRQDRRGGDLVTLPDNSVWLVVKVLEDWYMTSGWVKVAAVQQMTS